MQKMFGFANSKRTKRNTGEKTLDWNRDCLSYDSSAAKLPYSYYPQGKRAVEPFVRILTEPLGLSQKIYHHPTGRQFFRRLIMYSFIYLILFIFIFCFVVLCKICAKIENSTVLIVKN